MKYLILVLLLAGCSSTHVTKPTVPKYAPQGYKAKGAIKYLNAGMSFIIKKRREDAFKEMHEGCGGKYKITYEGPRESGSSMTTYNSATNTLNTHSSSYWYIEYECT